MKERDTITPLARGKPNGVLTQVLTEARREAEERRWAEEMKFTISTNIEDVLFKGRVRVNEMKLNDFLTRELGGRGIVDTNRDVLLEEFFKDPTKYIRDKGALKEIQASDRYKRMEGAVREEMDMEGDVHKLYKNGVDNLLNWLVATAEVKANVHVVTKRFLDAAAEEARNPTTSSAPIYLEGCYESVYNAGWHHVVEVPDGEGTGMEVREGEPPQSWTYRAVGDTLEKDDGVQQSGAPRPRLMVLTSDRGWPYSWRKEGKSIHDCHVNCEVERVWQTVRNDLTEWLGPDPGTYFEPRRRVLIGTPGIGKSMGAGSYLLYQLLHCDAKKLHLVIYSFGGNTTYVFDKTIKAVTRYVGRGASKECLRGLWQRGLKGYVIYDVTRQGTPPAKYFLPGSGWGMIVVSSPSVGNYDKWEKQEGAARIIMNCPAEMDVKAMCAWMKRDETAEKKAECWRMVKERMDNVGPIPRYIFDANKFIAHSAAIEDALDGINSRDGEEHFTHGGVRLWDSEDPSQKLVRVVRARGEVGLKRFRNAPICYFLVSRSANRLANAVSERKFLLLVLGTREFHLSESTEKFCLCALIFDGFVSAMAEELKELRPPAHGIQGTVLKANPGAHLTEICEIPRVEEIDAKQNINYRVLYIPVVRDFPLVDCFFFMESPWRTLVGLRMTTAGGHHTTASTVRQFTEHLSKFFNGWEEFAQGLSWEIIYVEHTDSTPMNGWRRCDVVNPSSVGDVDRGRIAEFWKTTNQCQFTLTDCFLRRMLQSQKC
ncbi:putative retrotransposon hot spot (RHS) protein [Trypanosoma cruzi]|uniref:Retrotransposon hot spot (RHS) protein, putative n=1 Tax=Trypanosoma cruzi (strain CL Brener) TaxID=353153 RepID=Q4D0T5_TRYCC|nr:retrotransposon hot spot (RHS) protein, putative [Trypanosoma cruzi]EAN86136.1 retrotransposon hot spot (RHS) protein, putative [Trypanosoma cruzi]RNC35196.1 putative retrotransposon hot spot (RHS) protein [Trypanosoma cruzi]|eukprot:XP_807987.1 retrotransposon hot spot (RHS) protein [Trypanosoma cruzi strain CL Brener]